MRPLDERLAEARALRDEARHDQPPPRPQQRRLHVPLTCPRCGGPWRHVTGDRERTGVTQRERRVVVACDSPGCRWEGAVNVGLSDLGLPRDLPRGA